MWVKSEYAGELAVLSAWLSVFLPWNVQHSEFGEYGSTLFVRFPLFQVQYSWFPPVRFEGELREFRQTGFQLIDGLWVADPVTAATFPEGVGRNIQFASSVWAVGALLLGVAFLFSIALYRDEEGVERRLPVDPVRAMGVLIGSGALVLGVVSWLIWEELPGFPFPVGLVVMVVLSATLLTVERTDAPLEVDADADADGD